MRSGIYDFFQMCANIRRLRVEYKDKTHAADDYEDFYTVCVEFINGCRRFNGTFREE